MLSLLISTLAFAAYGPNDISILLPLPPKQYISEMWGPRSGDMLLPSKVFAALPNLVMDRDMRSVYEHELKVVAIRIDPCFREGAEPCRRQVRFVWQPVVEEDGKVTTLDAAVHTFYQFNEHQWASLKRELPALVPNGRLAVHPRLAAEGYRGESWRKLGFLLRYCNPVTLVRATAMTVNPLGNVWFFAGVEVRGDGYLPAIQIPRVNDTVQGFFTSLQRKDTNQFRAAMNPAPSGVEPYLQLLNNSRTAQEQLTEEEIISATRESLRLQNPHLTHPGSVDCASCHSAHLVPAWSMRNFSWNWETIFARELFAESGRVILPEKKTVGADVLRMFGYFDEEPVIARRVIFETSEALKKM